MAYCVHVGGGFVTLFAYTTYAYYARRSIDALLRNHFVPTVGEHVVLIIMQQSITEHDLTVKAETNIFFHIHY